MKKKMKLKFISDDDVNAIKEDRKVLEKLAKKYGKLREKAGNFEVFSPDEEHYHMFKELQKLKVDVDFDDYDDEEIIQLLLSSKAWSLEPSKLETKE